MPWRPPELPEPDEVPHPRLAPHRRRAARITSPQGTSGLIYVDVGVCCTQLGGRMWWRRWSAPREFVVLYMDYPDGEFQDIHLDEEELDEEINSWERDEFYGHPFRNDEPTRYSLEWLSDDETSHVRSNFV